MKKISLIYNLFFFFLFFYSPYVGAHTSTPLFLDPFYTMVLIAAIAMLPIVVILTTNFTKIIVILSILRQALGTPQAPPNIVLISLAIILTCFSMYPVIKEIEQSIPFDKFNEKVTYNDLKLLLESTKKPIKDFLFSQTLPEDRKIFLDSQKIKSTEHNVSETDLIILIPAFLINQLSSAFKIGFLLYLPFVVVDMVIANLLMALGMQMLSPTTISLPFKILLFVLVDGWHLVAQGLIK